MYWLLAVVARILAEVDSPTVPYVEDEAVLFIKRADVMLGCTPGDAGVASDASVDAPVDAPDAGPSDAGVGDAGVPDAGMDPSCTMLAEAITMVLQPRVSVGNDGSRFAMLLVTPSRPFVESKEYVFEPLAQITAPETITTQVKVQDSSLGTRCAPVFRGGGCGGGWSDDGDDDYWDPPGFGDASLGDGGVVVETVGPYEYLRVQPANVDELRAWLEQHQFMYTQDDLDAVEPYLARGYTVVAVRVAIDQAMNALLTPIALTWAGTEIRLPSALSAGASNDELTVYVAADGTYTFPNAEVPFSRRTGSGTDGYLTRNELVLQPVTYPDDDPLATRAPQDLNYREVIEIVDEVRVPVEVHCDNDLGCCGNCNTRPDVRVDWLVLVGTVGFMLLRRRR